MICFVFTALLMLSQYDGITSIITAPFVVLFSSSILFLAALIAGLFLWLPGIRHVWRSSPVPVICVLCTGMLMISYGFYDRKDFKYYDEEAGQEVLATNEVNSYYIIAGSFAIVFAVANWPQPINSHNEQAH